MENPRISTPDTEKSPTDKKETTKDTTKKAERFGRLVVEKNPQRDKAERPSFFKLGNERLKAFDVAVEKPTATNELSKSETVDTAQETAKKTPEVAENSLENMDAEDTRYAKQQIAKHAREQLEADDAIEADEAEPLTRFYEMLEADADIDEAQDSVLEQLGVSDEETASEEEGNQPQIETVSDDSEQDPENPEDSTSEEALNEAAVEATPEDDEESAATATPPTQPVPSTPPVPPAQGPPTVPPQPPSARPTASSGGFAAPAVATFAAAPNTAPRQPDVRIEKGNTTGAFLLGGIVGYLVGRRRGRIKTEKKLKPIQKKLEKQVTDLQKKVEVSETKIRQAARKQAREKLQKQQPLETAESSKDVLLPTVVAAQAKPENTDNATPPQAELLSNKIVKKSEAAPQEKIEAPVAAEPNVPSRLAQMIVTAEAIGAASMLTKKEKPAYAAAKEQIKQPEKQPKELHADPEKSPEKAVYTMNRTELLATAESVLVDGASLRQIYETRLVGEQGLRRLLEVHLRGGDVKKQLRREITEREIDFERDPAMRDKAAKVAAAAAVGGAGQQFAAHAAQQVAQKHEEAAFYKARADHQAKEHVREQQKRRMLDVSLVTTIVVLVAFIAVVMVERM